MYIRQYNCIKVREILEKENNMQKNNGAILLLLGETYGQLDEYEKLSSVLLDDALKVHRYEKKRDFLKERYWRKNFNQGVESMNDKNYQTAARDLEYAVRIDPDKPESYRLLGQIYAEVQSYDKARNAYHTHIDLDKKDWLSCNNLAEFLFYDQQYEDAIRYSNMALNRNSQFQPAQIRIAECHAKLNHVDEALEAFEEAKKMGEHVDILEAYGKFCLKHRKYELAKTQFTRALSLSQSKVEFHKYLAECCYWLDEFYNVAKYYEKYLLENPEDIEAMKNLLVAYERTGDKENFGRVKKILDQISSRHSVIE